MGVPSGKPTKLWKITTFMGNQLYKGSMFNCYLSLSGEHYSSDLRANDEWWVGGVIPDMTLGLISERKFFASDCFDGHSKVCNVESKEWDTQYQLLIEYVFSFFDFKLYCIFSSSLECWSQSATYTCFSARLKLHKNYLWTCIHWNHRRAIVLLKVAWSFLSSINFKYLKSHI